MEVNKHRVWDVADLAQFKKSLLEEVFIKKEVSDTIKTDLKIIEKLMLHTYFEYDFIDVALIQSIFTLEKALKMRYVELGNRLKRSNTLEYLINWFFDKGYFETGSVSEIHSLRDIRNKKVHEIERHDKGLLYIKAVYSIFDLVNDLYEDRELREVRKKEIIETQVKLGDIYKDGCIFEIRDKRFIGFQAIPVFYNNKPGFNELSLNLWLIFDPNFVSFERGYAKNCVSATVTDWSFANDGLVGHLKEDGSSFSIKPISEESNQQKFNEWFAEFRSRPNWMVEWFVMTDKIGYTRQLRDFYQV